MWNVYTMQALLNSPTILSASTLAGYRVRSCDNQDLGTIEELMIDGQTGRIAFAVLCFASRAEFGDKLFAVPWDVLRLNAGDCTVVFTADQETLESAPTFQQEDWPDFGDVAWGAAIHSHYGLEPAFSQDRT